MVYPEKWRETCDPFALPYRSFQPTEILGYPHAGNDVFCAKGIWRGKEVTAYIKVARQHGAAIENEVSILSQLRDPVFPQVIDYGLAPQPFSVTLALPGERLSVILGENSGMESLAYLPDYGAALARLHRMTPDVPTVKDRRFFHAPSEELLEQLGLEKLKSLFQEAPTERERCFCHGDFHYANVLWQKQRISGILDFELCGYGSREFDIAWALFLRPGQKFLKTAAEQEAFLDGYAQNASFNRDAVLFYMAQCYVYFLQIGREDAAYCQTVRAWLLKKT